MSTSVITPAAGAISSPPAPGARPPALRRGRSVHDLLAPLVNLVVQSEVLRADSLGFWRSGEDLLFLPRFFFQRRKVHKPRIKVGIFAGIHGDEPSSVLGLMQLARALERYPEMGRNYQLWLYPLCNPGGYIDGTRESRSGKDLNRQFWKNSSELEVQLLEKEISKQRFNGIISLHCDDTSYGVYGFGGGALNERLLKQGLAAERALPRNIPARKSTASRPATELLSRATTEFSPRRSIRGRRPSKLCWKRLTTHRCDGRGTLSCLDCTPFSLNTVS